MLNHDVMNRYRSLILAPIVTEKSLTEAETLNKYTFRVLLDANKIEIRSAVETIFNVRVTAVNTLNVLGKARRRSFKYRQGKTARWKKAIVTLAPGYRIDVVETG